MFLPRMAWWQVKQVSLSRAVLSWALADRGVWTLWQEAQLTLRREWTPPEWLAWRPLLWQVRQVSSTLSAESFFMDGPGVLTPSNCDFMCTAATPASWQETQPLSSVAWTVCFMPPTAASWQVAQSFVSISVASGGAFSS